MDDPDTTPDAPARSCAACGAGMEHHQDWCLECGTAAPGRLGGARPGWRAVSTTLGLTLALVGGAGAASYAALSSDANREAIASVPADGTPVAQAPPAVPAPPAPVLPPPPVAPPRPPKIATTPAAKLPVAPKVTPGIAAPGTTAQVTPSPTRTTPSGGSTRSESTAAGDRGAGTRADEDARTPQAELETIALAADAVRIYDPYKRSVSPGDPAKAHDGDAGTALELGAPDDGRELQLGVVVDLDAVKQVRALELLTTTPGARVEVYATDSSTVPPDILDTRWDHPASRSDAGRKERIVLPKGGARFRYVAVWFTTPPDGTRRVKLSELRILG